MPKTIYSKDHRYTVERLKKARLNAGLDQVKVGKLLGRSQSYISKIESGQRRIDTMALKEFAQAYHKSVNYFIK